MYHELLHNASHCVVLAAFTTRLKASALCRFSVGDTAELFREALAEAGLLDAGWDVELTRLILVINSDILTLRTLLRPPTDEILQ